MAYDLIVGKETAADFSIGCGEPRARRATSSGGDDDDSASFIWTGPYVPGRDAVDNVGPTYPEETFKAAMARLRSLSPEDQAKRRAYRASRQPRARGPASSAGSTTSGHALAYDSLGRATIVDVPRARARGRQARGKY